MAKQKTAESESAKQVVLDVLRAADGPLKAKEIAKRVIDSRRCPGLKGKTPEATISAMLAVGSKPGGPFTRVDKGTYALADTTRTASKPAQPPTPSAASKPTRTRRTAQARKPESPVPKRRTAKRSR
jgi:HB1, ASXL, restriction endonuclease HTH domain